MSKRIKGPFKLHKYPYHYKCNHCSYKFDVTKETENYWKDGYDIFSDEPLFFVCEKCRIGKATPIGYKYINEFDNFCVPPEPTDEQKAEWDEIFGPLDD
ncbi:MAG: hypothetical protein HOB19_02605 [Elusimicrobiaceae bacterium]|jgi:hypothetical protein|nr:hypothetical protein [Elusimicrobiaceae bacterium]